ncbi:Alpha/beta hydrolase family protein [compost metagenome]
MNRILSLIGLLLFLLPGLSKGAHAQQNQQKSVLTVRPDTLTLFDKARARRIPIAIFRPMPGIISPQLIILSHGYGANDPGSYLTYRGICNFLAWQGYMVISIQHELPTDELIPMEGKPQIVRRPFWDRGADNILFVIRYAQAHYVAQCNTRNIVLIGHSNGGDMSALFPQKYPGLVSKVITLDNRRMALPRTKKPRIYSLRSSDQPADEGVLPAETEAKKLGMKIIKLPATIHNDMDDGGTEAQQAEINGYIKQFLQEK